jgi:H+/Cl- antiporter ClcA
LVSKFTILRYLVRLKNTYVIRKIKPFLKRNLARWNETNSKISEQLFQSIPFWIASALTGLLAYLYYLVFRYTEALSFDLVEKYRWSIFILTPVSFFISWWLVRRFAPFAKGSGIPQVMAAIEISKPTTRPLVDQLLSLRIILVKVFSSAFKVLGGGVVGREGPTIQIASSVFQVVYKYLPFWWKPISQKNILVAGAASGLAAAFNTPLGGIIFAIEELSKFHIKSYKSSLFVAVVIAGLVAQSLGGSYLYLGYPKLEASGWMVYLGVLIVSILSGFFGAKVGAFLWKVVRYIKSKKKNSQQITVVILASILVSTSIYFLGMDAMGSGKEIMERTLFTSDKSVEWYIPFVRMGGLISSFGMGGAGGIFAPSLSIGASIGAVVSGMMELTGHNTNLLIVVGMTAFLTGITRSPFTSAIVVIEMTDRHSAIFFLMFAAVIASAIAYIVERKSLYDFLKEAYIDEVKK